MTKIEFGNRSEFYKSTDLKMNEEVFERVSDVHEASFPHDDGSFQKKWVLDFDDGKGLALNGTNTKFLIEKGFQDYEELIGRKVKIRKEVRILKTVKGDKEGIGLFLVQVE